MSSITLYHTQPTRSVKIMVLLEEMGVAYAVKAVDLKKREQKTPEYLALNPFGKVPTLTDGPLVLFESSAIAYYLLEKYDANRKLSPPPGTRENAVHHLVIAHSIAAEALLSVGFHEVYVKGIGEGKEGNRDVFLSAAKEFSTVYVPLYEKWLGDNEYFGGVTPSAADAFAGYLCFYATLEIFEEKYLTSEKLLAYWERMKKRESFQKALQGSPFFRG